MTIPEYELLIQAVKLKEVDKDYRNHLQAFLNYAAKAQKKAGKGKTKPVYSRFNKFYNYEKAQREARNIEAKESRFSGIGKLLK